MKKKRKNNASLNQNYKNVLKKIFKYILFLGVMGTFFFKIIKFQIQDYKLQRYGKTTIGYIINEKGYNGIHGHLTDDKHAKYMYTFNINGKTYKGDSQNNKYKIGDTITIIYLQENPKTNRPYYYLK